MTDGYIWQRLTPLRALVERVYGYEPNFIMLGRPADRHREHVHVFLCGALGGLVSSITTICLWQFVFNL